MTKNKKELESTTIRLSLQERHKRVWEALFYTHQRLDTLLIAISGAGIYVCLETLKYYATKGLIVHPMIKISAALLVVAIITNFFSQWSASRVHYSDYYISSIDFICEESKKDRNEHFQEIQKHEHKISIYEKIDRFLSISSIILMSAGLICVIVFFFFIF
ncbi:hypothetical protein [Flavobacterium lindanitolerans]|uniref:hypothetical protein n=1 Tax=Flavobacterium lindanitolerans TaxID=428988 RepID=UPI0027BA039F|nr:hypothetical protein [Flavobacterium lindanitolerans]